MQRTVLAALLYCVFSLSWQPDALAQTDDDLITTLKAQVARVSSSIDFTVDSFSSKDEGIARDNYSFTLTGSGSFIGIPGVSYVAYFNKDGKPNFFRATLPDVKTAGNLNLDALTASNSLQQFFLPPVFQQNIVLSSWTAEFNTASNTVSKLTLKFRVAGQFTPIEDWDMSLKEVVIGYEIENPLAAGSDRKYSALLGATMNMFGAEVNISSNLVTKMEDWKITADIYNINIPLATIWEKMKGDKIMPWPSFMDNFNISKLQVDLTPASELDITAWTDLGNFNFMVKRSVENKPAPLSTQLTGGYPTKTASTGTLSTQLTGGYTNTSSTTTSSTSSGSSSPASTQLTGGYNSTSTSSTDSSSSTLSTQLTGGYTKTATDSSGSSNTATGTQSSGTTQAVYEILAAYSLPENLAFGGSLQLLNSFKPSNAGIVISTFKKPTETTLPIFAGLGKGDATVQQGVTFLALVDIENFRQQNLKTVLKNIAKYTAVTNPLNSILFRANLPLPPRPFQDFTASAALNFSKDMNFFNRVYIKNMSLEGKPLSGDPEFSLYGTVDVVWDDPAHPLRFKGGFGIQPATLTVTGKAQMDGVMTLPHPYGFPKLSLANLALTTGIKFSTEIPTPDNVFLSGQMMINKIVGNATIALDQNEFGKNMIVARFCNVDFNSVIDAFCGPDILNMVPTFVRNKVGGTGLKNVYVKLIPPGASTNFIGGPPPDPGFTDNCYPIPSVRDNDFSPGFKLAAQAELLNWKGGFVFGFEGDMTGLSAGLTAVASMTAIKLPVKIAGLPLFELTGAGGRGNPELFIDLSTRHLINGITNQFSPLRSETETRFRNGEACFLQARHSGRVVEIAAASKSLEANVQQYDLNRSAAQAFVFEPAADGYYAIKNVNSGMYLDVHMGLAQPGRKIWQYVGNGSPAQLFKPVMNSDGYFELQSKLSPDLVVEVANEGMKNGAILQINRRNRGAYNQEFRQLMADAAVDPSTSTGYRANQVIYGSGRLTILGLTANAYLDLNTDGFQCNLNGKILGFLEGNIQATVADFGNPLTGTSVTGTVNQTVVATIQDKAKDVIKAAFGSRMAKVFGAISSKVLDIRSISFAGNLDQFKSGLALDVRYAIAGKEYKIKVNADVGDVASLSKKVGEAVVKQSKAAFETLMDEGEQIMKAVADAAEKAAAEMKEQADKALDVAKDATKTAISTANEAKDKMAEEAKVAFNATTKGVKDLSGKAEDFFKDFGSFSAKVVEKIYKKPIKLIKNGWDDFTKDVKRFFTGADNEELLMYNGPGFRVVTKSGQVIRAYPSRQKDRYATVGVRQDRPEEIWQLAPNDTEGSFFLVSAYNGMLVANGLRTGKKVIATLIIPHESDHKNRERLVMEPVPGDPGWYYLKYRADNYYLVVRNGVLMPSPTRGNSDNGRFRFEQVGDISWDRTKKTKEFPADLTPAPALVEGSRYQVEGQPEQFLYTDGSLRWIPDVETLAGAGLDGRPLVVLPASYELNLLTARPLPSRKDGALLQARNTSEKYIMDKGRRRWIPDLETFNMLGLQEGMVQVVNQQDLNAIPEGAPLPSGFKPAVALQERVMYQVTGDQTIYLVLNGKVRPVPDIETFFALGYQSNMVQQVTANELKALPTGAPLPSRKDGILLRAGSEPEVYIMDRGLRRLVPDIETFQAMKLNMGNVVSLAKEDFLAIPVGPQVPSVK